VLRYTTPALALHAALPNAVCGAGRDSTTPTPYRSVHSRMTIEMLQIFGSIPGYLSTDSMERRRERLRSGWSTAGRKWPPTVYFRESGVYLNGPACRHWAGKRAPTGFVAWRHRTGKLFGTPPHVYAVKAALGTSSVVQQEAYPFLPNPSSSRPVRMR
jgi:hypothetical protein